MAPINLPDGSQVSQIVLPDGSTASEVLAPDGSTVFAGIPDISMFNDVSAQYWAASTSTSAGNAGEFPEVSSNVPDATATNSPIFRTDVSDGSNSFDAFEYDGSNGIHEIQTQSTPDLPEGNTPLSVFVLYIADDKDTNVPFEYGQDGTAVRIRPSDYRIFSFQTSDFSGGDGGPIGTWNTLGFVRTSSGFELYADGEVSPLNTRSGTGSFTADGFIGAGLGGDPIFNGHIAELIISGTDETGTAYQNWHNDRLS